SAWRRRSLRESAIRSSAAAARSYSSSLARSSIVGSLVKRFRSQSSIAISLPPKPGLRQRCRGLWSTYYRAVVCGGQAGERRRAAGDTDRLAGGTAAEQRRGLLSERPLARGPARSHEGPSEEDRGVSSVCGRRRGRETLFGW